MCRGACCAGGRLGASGGGAGRSPGGARISDHERHVLGRNRGARRIAACRHERGERAVAELAGVRGAGCSGRPADRHAEDVPDPRRLLRHLPPRDLHAARRRDARSRVGAEQHQLPDRRLPQQLRRPDPGDGHAGQLPARPVRHQHLAEGSGCVLDRAAPRRLERDPARPARPSGGLLRGRRQQDRHPDLERPRRQLLRHEQRARAVVHRGLLLRSAERLLRPQRDDGRLVRLDPPHHGQPARRPRA